MTSNLEYSSPSPASVPAWLIAACCLMCGLVIICLLSGVFMVDVLSGLAIDSLLLGIYLVSACGWGWWIAGRCKLRVITSVAVGLGMMSLVTLGLGLAGLFNFYAAIGVVFVGLIALAGAMKKGTRLTNPFTIRVDHWTWLFIGLIGLLSVAAVAASICPGYLWKPLDPHPYDVLSYHLQVPREWFEAGRIIPLTHNAFSYFPMGMEMHYLSAMTLCGGPWSGMYLCQYFSLAHGGLTIIAIAQIAVALGSTPIRGWSVALGVACVPWMFQLSVVAYVESGVMLYTTLAMGWLLMELRNPSPRGAMIIGLLAGLACGMKYTAIPMTACLIIGVASMVYLFARRYRCMIITIIVTIAAASPWLIRNTAWTGNPVFPLATSIFGQAHFTDEQVERYRIAHQPPASEQAISSRLANGFWRTIGDAQFGWLILPCGTVALIALFLSRLRRECCLLAIVILGMVLIWIFATHLMPRFITPIVPLMGIAIAILPVNWGAALSFAAMQGVIGLGLIFNWLNPSLALGKQGLFRLNDLRVLETKETKFARLAGDQVALIGDAQAFFYVVPPGKLIYRSVFDVQIDDDVSTVDGWLGESVESLRKRGIWVVINTSELNRLSTTYRNIPKPSAPYDHPQPSITLPPYSRMR